MGLPFQRLCRGGPAAQGRKDGLWLGTPWPVLQYCLWPSPNAVGTEEELVPASTPTTGEEAELALG